MKITTEQSRHTTLLIHRSKSISRLFLLLILTLLSACSGFEGTFKTDQEMIDYLAENIDEFKTLADEKNNCNTISYSSSGDNVRSEGCNEKINILGLIKYIYYEQLSLSTYSNDSSVFEPIEGLVLDVFVERWGNGIDYNGYIKGYIYTYDNTIESSLWEEGLNSRAKNGSCGNEIRISKIADEEIPANWYLYDMQYCENGA